MPYFILLKVSDGGAGSLYRIAENESDLNNLNLIKSDYIILEDSQVNFDNFKYRNKSILNFDNNNINYTNFNVRFENKNKLINYIETIRLSIKEFLENNKNHALYNRWKQYDDQLKNLNLDNIVFPLEKSLEQYFKDLGQPSYNIIQIP
jgi:hypothetical protein